MHIYMCYGHGSQLVIGGQLVSFYYVSHKAQIQVIRRGGKHLYSLDHLTGLDFEIANFSQSLYRGCIPCG